MDKVKILWVSRFAPVSTDPEAGTKTFNYYFRQIESDNRFEIKLISMGRPEKKVDIEKENESIEKTIIYWSSTKRDKLKNIINVESKYNPFNRFANLISNTEVKAIKKQLTQYKNNGYAPDIVILEWTNMVLLASYIKKVFPQCKVVASEHDVTFVGYERKSKFYSGLTGLKWKIRLIIEKKLELNNLRKCDLVLPHNKENKAILVENGIEESKIQGLVPYFNNMENIKRNPKRKDILFFGAMARPENYLSAEWFITNVMPKLEKYNLRFVILGSNPSDTLKKYEGKSVHITGFVDSIEPYFSEAMCLVAPLVLGAGIKVKILEAMSSGIPVLTNDIGIEGILAKDRLEYVHCEKPEEYANAVIQILKDIIDTKSLECHEKHFIKENFSYIENAKIYKKNLFELAGRK